MATSPNYGWLEPDNTDLVKNGALAIRTLGNAIDTTMATMVPKSIVDAKGDLIAGTAADTAARLAVGNNGETLVADSSTSTGLRYQGSQAAGKNYQINGGFDVWQRSTSSSTLNAYATADRWYQAGSGTVTYSRDTDVPANQGFTYSAKWLTGASSSFGEWYSALEAQDVNALAGRQVTLSFWVKATGSFTGTISARLQSGNTANTLLGGTWTSIAEPATATPTGTWTRYSTTVNVTAGSLGLRVLIGVSSAQPSGVAAFVTGVQIELGSVATTFTRAGGSIQGETSACQRYYYRTVVGGAESVYSAGGTGQSSTATAFFVPLPVPMRITPASVDFSTLSAADFSNTPTGLTNLTLNANNSSRQIATVNGTSASGITQYRPYVLASTNANGYVGFSAEL